MVLVGYRISQPWIRGIARVYPSGVSVLHIGGVLLTFHIWIVLGQFFALSSLEHAVHIQWLMLTDLVNASTLTHRDAATVLYYVWPLVVMQVAQLWRGDMYVVFRLPFAARYFIYLLMFLLLLANGGEINQDFIYFQF